MSHSARVLLAFLVARTERFLRNEVVVVPARLGTHRVADHRDRHLVQHLLGSCSCDTMTRVFTDHRYHHLVQHLLGSHSCDIMTQVFTDYMDRHLVQHLLGSCSCDIMTWVFTDHRYHHMASRSCHSDILYAFTDHRKRSVECDNNRDDLAVLDYCHTPHYVLFNTSSDPNPVTQLRTYLLITDRASPRIPIW